MEPIIAPFVTEISLTLGDFVGVVGEDVIYTAAVNVKLAAEVLDAPLHKGDIVGYMTLIVNSKEAARVDLVAAEEVRQRRWLDFLPFFRRN